MIKKYYRKIYRTWLGKKLSSEEFLHILTSLLDLKKGDSVLVHASFGNLKPDFSPEKAVEILMNVVGKEGNLLMPYYPYDSKKFLESGEVFDVNSTPTRSGILSATFSMFPEVKKSIHPIKAMAVWGKDRDFLISDHQFSKTPYDEHSPYGKLLNINNAKSIGLGVFKNLVVHAAEDIVECYPRYYEPIFYEGFVKDYHENLVKITTPVHGNIKMVPSCEYLRITECPGYAEVSFKKRRFYTSNYLSAFKHIKQITEEHGLTAEKVLNKQTCIDKITSRIVRL
ncbi:MAG: AAC(3) family N-acetyltransferase [Bacteroidales bacterium]